MSDTAEKFRSLFRAPGGEEVLAEICRMGHLFEECQTDAERIEENFAKRILNLAKADEEGFIEKHVFWDIFKKIKNWRAR